MPVAATKGQVLRGHGKAGWADAGWDLDNHILSDNLKHLVLAYGEMAQATYDNLGMDRCQATTFGYSVKQPNEMLSYLTSQYPLAPSAPEPNAPGTADMYELPPLCDDGLSPIIHAKPGKSSGSESPVKNSRWGVLQVLADKLFDTIAGALVTFVDGSNGGRRLFVPDPTTGRGIMTRSTFIGFVAVSKPQGAEKEVDVALVWRGTIFKEEWESNFAEDKLTEWMREPGVKADSLEQAKPQPRSSMVGKKGLRSTGLSYARRKESDEDVYNVPKPSQVGVHNGFDDLYNRRINQPHTSGPGLTAKDGQEHEDSTTKDQDAEDSTKDQLSPREVTRMWLRRLFKVHNVTTITCTGHSLGGALATIAAFGAADLLEEQWDSEEWRTARATEMWATQEKPKVSLITFAAPRVGNFAFGRKFRSMGVRAMRVVNKGDMVPNVPGLVVQGLSNLVEAVPFLGKRAAIDMDSPLVLACSWLYYGISQLTSLVYPDYWGYFHIGQVLEVDPAQAAGTVKANDFGSKHNLELYLHLVSKLGRTETQRNPLLLNKSADLWTDPNAPADWWSPAPPALPHRSCTPTPKGRWTV